jgi:photosystem II stability/assembly factor-like uncharacterized protein
MNRAALTLLLFSSMCPVDAGMGQDYWLTQPSPTTKDLQKVFFLDSLNGWIVGNEGTILHTTTGGTTWTAQDAIIRSDIVDIFMLDKWRGWALSHEFASAFYGTILLETTDGGTTWSNRRYPEEEVFLNSVKFFDAQTGWMAGEFGVLVGTTNGGADWFNANLDSALHLRWDLANLKFYSPHYGYAMGGRFDITGVIWKTADGGASWLQQTAGPEPVYDIHFFDSLNVLGIGGDYDFGSGKLVTTDGGESWEYTYLGIWGQARAISFRTPTEAWVPLGFAGTYMYTLDAGETWTDLPVPGIRPMYDLIFVDSTRGYMVGGGGTILKFNSPPVSVGEQDEGFPPSAAVLHPAYPNPFNPSTTIRFRLGERNFVSLSVYDIRGVLVEEILRGSFDQGDHEAFFNAHDLSSGVYFYTLTSFSNGIPSRAVSRSMTLVK